MTTPAVQSLLDAADHFANIPTGMMGSDRVYRYDDQDVRHAIAVMYALTHTLATQDNPSNPMSDGKHRFTPSGICDFTLVYFADKLATWTDITHTTMAQSSIFAVRAACEYTAAHLMEQGEPSHANTPTITYTINEPVSGGGITSGGEKAGITAQFLEQQALVVDHTGSPFIQADRGAYHALGFLDGTVALQGLTHLHGSRPYPYSALDREDSLAEPEDPEVARLRSDMTRLAYLVLDSFASGRAHQFSTEDLSLMAEICRVNECHWRTSPRR